jgi:hypothetical protein
MQSQVEEPTIVVPEAFTSGGSQQDQRPDVRFDERSIAVRFT